MSGLASVLVMAVLFMAFGWVRQRPGCSGSCGACEGGCELEGTEDP
jgi:hypothetical protein